MKQKLVTGVSLLCYILQSCPLVPFCHFAIMILHFCGIQVIDVIYVQQNGAIMSGTINNTKRNKPTQK